jgi:Fe2+ transport system protein FeoA
MIDTPKKLSDLKLHEKGAVRRINGGGAVRRRMMDMGLTTGTEVAVLRIAPLGDPIEFDVRGYHLSLRKSEAANIEVDMPHTPEDPQ